MFPIATAEPGDEESVTRAKYFIRDEFLVSKALLYCFVRYLDYEAVLENPKSGVNRVKIKVVNVVLLVG